MPIDNESPNIIYPGDFTQTQYLVDRIRNSTGVAEGTGLPPRTIGFTRVPAVQSVFATNVVKNAQGTQVTVQWKAPEGFTNINTYRLYVKNAYDTNAEPVYAASSAKSPCTFLLPGTISGIAVIFVQTVLNNGYANTVSTCPTTTINTQEASVISIAAVTPAGAAGTIDFGPLASGTYLSTIINLPAAKGGYLNSLGVNCANINGVTNPPILNWIITFDNGTGLIMPITNSAGDFELTWKASAYYISAIHLVTSVSSARGFPMAPFNSNLKIEVQAIVTAPCATNYSINFVVNYATTN